MKSENLKIAGTPEKSLRTPALGSLPVCQYLSQKSTQQIILATLMSNGSWKKLMGDLLVGNWFFLKSVK